MKFKDVSKKHIFTWWEHAHHYTGVKIGEKQAFCFDTLELLDIHHNKDVKEPERISEDMTLKFGRNGQAYLCQPGNADRVLARRVVLIGGELMREDELKTAKPLQAGERQDSDEQVYIILSLLIEKLKDLETLGKTVQIILDGKSECDVLDKKIMSTLGVKNAAALTE